MNHPPEHNPDNTNQLLDELEFIPEPPSLEEQQLALLGLQNHFMNEWINDPDGFMTRLIMRLDPDVDLNSSLTRIYPGLQFKESALGSRIQEQVILRIHKEYLPPGSSIVQSVNRNLPLVTITADKRRCDLRFKDTDIALVEAQIEALRQLRQLCPNLNEDLMTLSPTPGKALELPWRSDAYIASRLQQ